MLPAGLLDAVETHGCFSGCYRGRPPARICIDASRPVESVLEVECSDCLDFRVGALERLVPRGMTSAALATVLGEHMRQVRGYRWSVGGYHPHQNGLWLSAVSLGNGVFLARGKVSVNNNMSDLESFVQGLRLGVITTTDARMFNLKLYRTQRVYLTMSPPLGSVRSAGDLLASPQCSPTQRPGLSPVTLVEYLPLVNRAMPAGKGRKSPRSREPYRPLVVGERCDKCGELVEERPSLTSTFIGCMC